MRSEGAHLVIATCVELPVGAHCCAVDALPLVCIVLFPDQLHGVGVPHLDATVVAGAAGRQAKA